MDVPLGTTTLHLSRTRAVLLLLAVGIAGYSGYDYVQQSRAVEDAVPVQATVSDADVLRDDGGGQTEWIPDVEYSYRYRDETYTSDQVFPGLSARGYYDRSKAASVIEPYEPGTTARAYVVPDAPGNAFLVRERDSGSLLGVGFGILGIVVVVLSGIGEQTVGRAEPRSEDERSPPGRRSWLQRNDERLHRLSRRLFATCFAAFWLSMVVLVFGVLNATRGLEGPQPEIRADLLGPVGLPLLAAAVSYVGTVLSVCLYGVWSFGEYRELRRRLDEPKPPSPFRHPSRLTTILGTDHEVLSQYGKRVRMTGVAFVGAAFLTGLFLYVVSTAG